MKSDAVSALKHSRREKHRDHRNSVRTLRVLICGLLLFPVGCSSGVLSGDKIALGPPFQPTSAIRPYTTYEQDRCQEKCDFLPPPPESRTAV